MLAKYLAIFCAIYVLIMCLSYSKPLQLHTYINSETKLRTYATNKIQHYCYIHNHLTAG